MPTATTSKAATVEQHEVNGVRVVRLSGSLTQKGVADVGPLFAAAVRGEERATQSRGGPGTVVVDLTGVDVIATTGITLLLVADRDLKKDGGGLVLAGTRGLVKDVLLRCRLDKVLTLAPSVDEAIESARRPA
jgi:anti-anti-sigma factor